MIEPATTPPAASDRTLMIVLAYLWVLALVPLLVYTGDPDVRWHAKHGIVLAVAEFAALVAWTILASILSIMTGGLLGFLFVLLTPLLVVVAVILHVVAMARALHGHRVIIPGLSEFAERF